MTRDLLKWVRATRRVKIRHTYSHQQEPWNALADVCADFASDVGITTGFPLRDLRLSERDMAWQWLKDSDEAIQAAYPDIVDGHMEASYCKSKAVPEDVDENHGLVEDDNCQPQVLKFVSITSAR